MSNTLQYVADRIALMDVMLQQAKGVDERDFDLYRGVFADDAAVVGFGPDTFHGADAWSVFVKQELSQIKRLELISRGVRVQSG